VAALFEKSPFPQGVGVGSNVNISVLPKTPVGSLPSIGWGERQRRKLITGMWYRRLQPLDVKHVKCAR
jgi:hypothetical protein